MDFIIDLPPSKRRNGGTVYDSMLVIMDWYTKIASNIPSRKDIEVDELADVTVNKHALRGAYRSLSFQTEDEYLSLGTGPPYATCLR